jgi:hypothetical protein
LLYGISTITHRTHYDNLLFMHDVHLLYSSRISLRFRSSRNKRESVYCDISDLISRYCDFNDLRIAIFEQLYTMPGHFQKSNSTAVRDDSCNQWKNLTHDFNMLIWLPSQSAVLQSITTVYLNNLHLRITVSQTKLVLSE